MKIKNSLKIAKIGYIMISLFMMLTGLVIIINPIDSAVIFCNVIGVLFSIFGIIKLIGYFSRDLYRLAFQYDLAFGILTIVIGIIMLLHPGEFIKLFNICLGLLILADGLFKIQLSLDAKAFGIERWWLIIMGAIIAGIFGVVLIIVPASGIKPLSLLLGLSFLSEGVLNLFVALHTVQVIRLK